MTYYRFGFYSFFFSFLLTFSVSYAQSGDEIRLKGSLSNAEGQPLEFATVSLYRLTDSTLLGGSITDVDGKFELEIGLEKAYLAIEFVGFEGLVINPLPLNLVDPESDILNLGTLTLYEEALDLGEVEIRAERSETQFSLDKRVFHVGKDLANQGGSAMDVLDNVPSVSVTMEEEVSLRGSTGVRILINGRRSGLGESLRSIPANMIERIEVVTNPSARYDAEGTSGIINIILKKEQREGFNGSFDLNGGYPWQAGIGGNINYRKNKVNWFAQYGFRYREGPGQGSNYQEFYQPNGQIDITEQFNDRNRTGASHTGRFGMDYFFNDKTSLTGSFRYQLQDGENFATNRYLDYVNVAQGDPIRSSTREDVEAEDETETEYSLLFQKEMSSRDHKLTISLDYEDEIETELSELTETIRPKDQTAFVERQRSSNEEEQREWALQADYVHPFAQDHQMEFGVKGSYRQIHTDFSVDDFVEESWVRLDGLSNTFEYDEYIYAAYAQYGNKFGPFSVQVGLRTEYADITTRLIQTEEVNPRIRLDWFPSAYLNYEFSETDAIQANYSRRIERPHFWYLNPFFSYSDNRNIRTGNPNLNPQYTDSYELNYLRYWDELTLSLGVFYRYSTGVIERIKTVEIDTVGNQITYTKPENLATRDDYGLEASINYSALKWLRLDATANFFRSITDGTNFGEGFYADNYTWESRLTGRFTFWKNSDLQIRMNYRAPQATTQGRQKSMTSVDIGWSKDFLPENNLTVTLSVRDLFNSRKWRYEQFGPDFSATGDFQWRARSVNLALNYRINQKKERPERPGEGGEFNGGEGDF